LSSAEELGKKTLSTLQDGDVDGFMEKCTVHKFSRSELIKFGEAASKAKGGSESFDPTKWADIWFGGEKSKEEAELKERWKNTIEQGMNAGLNWKNAKFEYIDTSRFETKKEMPSYGGGNLYIIISENGKRWKIELNETVLVPGFGYVNLDGVRWRGELK